MRTVRILAVDDEQQQLSALRRILRRCPWEIHTATNGRDGLRLAVRQPPDLILLDVNMPEMSGYEFLRRFRRLELRRGLQAAKRASGHPRLPSTPVIFVTGLGGSSQCRDGLAAGATDYVTKPYDPEELQARIERHLQELEEHRRDVSLLQRDLEERESSLQDLRDAAQVCMKSLVELTHFVELSEYQLNAQLRKVLAQRARKDMSRLLRTVAELAEQPLPENILA